MKWLDPKLFAPPIDLPFIAYVEDIYIFEIFGSSEEPKQFPVNKVITAVLSENDLITDLFSLYERNHSVFKLSQLISWRKLPKCPNLRKQDEKT